MRVAALFDIHGNLPALDAVLEDIRRTGVDQIVVGGDVVPGPLSRETVARLLSLDRPVQFIRGNGEIAVLAEIAGENPYGLPDQMKPWLRDQDLLPEQQDEIGRWPRTVTLDVGGIGRVLFCHATPRDENEIFTKLTPDAPLLPIFDGLGAALVVCGHTHMQFDRVVGSTRVVNAGSVGMPFGEPGADWLLLGPGVELRHTSYDLEAAARRIRQSRWGPATEFAARNVLQPPSEQDMVDAFTPAGLK